VHPDPAFLVALEKDLTQTNRQMDQELVELQDRAAAQDARLLKYRKMTEQMNAIKSRLDTGDPSAVDDYRKLVHEFETMTGRVIGRGS
jgi:hypothetical protein